MHDHQDEANGPKRHAPTDWNIIEWQQAERSVRNLRQRIFRASREGNWKRVNSLQKLLLRSRANTLQSVRRVTQDNRGRHTAGVDRVLIKTTKARGAFTDLVSSSQPWRASPTKRVYIPKSNGKVRPLGIPTLLDRCLQARVKNVLEPSWEAQFEGSSYGFRPGRGCHDAIKRIYFLARPHLKKKWVLDADIRGAFDHISHEYLLKTIGKVPGKELIRAWLKAGYVDHNIFHATEEGTPQGGVISPLLANIALHGMEEALGITYRADREHLQGKRGLVRYADDFVVFCESREDAQEVQQILTLWLANRGLQLSAEKTKIVHLSEGFNFLGYTIKHYRSRHTKTGFKLLITPSREAIAAFRQKVKGEWLKLKGQNARAITHRLNPIVRGWCNYYRVAVASKVFHGLDRWMFGRAVRFAKHSHPKKSWKWLRERYWGQLTYRRDQWVFGDKATGAFLLKLSWFKIERHVMVKGRASPDDGSLREYWEKRRRQQSRDLTLQKQRQAARQEYRCPVCRGSLFNGEEIHVHHIKARKKGGTNSPTNLVLVHLYCHQQIHSKETKSDQLPL